MPIIQPVCLIRHHSNRLCGIQQSVFSNAHSRSLLPFSFPGITQSPLPAQTSAMAAAATEPLLLYSARICPWAQRATLALQETGLPHSIYEIDLQVRSFWTASKEIHCLTSPACASLLTQNKPSWYNSKINPASKVPGEPEFIPPPISQ